MTRVLTRDVIEQALTGIDLLPLMEAGFAAYSEGRCNIPPVGELMLEKGEVHIKYGCITGGRYYVVKVASGFYGNPALGLASSNGLMLVGWSASCTYYLMQRFRDEERDAAA